MKYNTRVSNYIKFKVFQKVVSKNHKMLTANNSYYSVFLNDAVSNSIQVTGLYESEILIPLFRILSRKFDFSKSTAIDIGANIGNHSVFFSKIFNKVICFEPNPITYKLLTVNTFHINNVQTVNLGISDKAEELSLSVLPGNIGGSSTIINHDSSLNHKIELIRLDDYHELPGNVDLIKIDVEGMETLVLNGAKELIISKRPIILFEQWASQFNNGDSDVTKFLTDSGYLMFTLVESNYHRNKWLRRLKRIPLVIINGSLKYKIQNISFFQKIDYSMIIAIHESQVSSDILILE
jgi:FkbM family methyltransferase